LQQNYFVVTWNAFCGVKTCTWSNFFFHNICLKSFWSDLIKEEKKIFFSCCFCLCLYIRFRFQHHKGSNNNTIGKQINKDWRANCSWIVFAFVHIFVILFGFGWDWEIIRLFLMTNFNISPTCLWTFSIEAQKLKLQGGGGGLEAFWQNILMGVLAVARKSCLSSSFIGFLCQVSWNKIWGYMGYPLPLLLLNSIKKIFDILNNKVFLSK
jgi:hypothetical protein